MLQYPYNNYQSAQTRTQISHVLIRPENANKQTLSYELHCHINSCLYMQRYFLLKLHNDVKHRSEVFYMLVGQEPTTVTVNILCHSFVAKPVLFVLLQIKDKCLKYRFLKQKYLK